MTMSSKRMLAGLLDASHLLSIEQLPEAVREHAAHAGFTDVRIYLTDLQEDVLRPLTGKAMDAAARGAAEAAEAGELPIDGTLAGQAFAMLQPLAEPRHTTGGIWWVPLLGGAERIGVLRVTTSEPGSRDLKPMRRLAALVAMLIIAKRPHSDFYARVRRRRPMSVAAELQWNLIPPRVFTHNLLTVSCALEPAYEIGGDAFDYALTGDVLYLAIFDAAGHDMGAGITANLAVAASRTSRRQRGGPLETGMLIERTLIEQLGEHTRFVTALLGELELSTGRLTWASYGHHAPVLVRQGRWSELNAPSIGTPLGTDFGIQASLCHDRLQPGDRLVLYTDGVIEVHDLGGEEFGLDRFMSFIIDQNTQGLPVPETLRRLVHNVLEHHNERLRDDATVMFLEWHGPDGQTKGGQAGGGTVPIDMDFSAGLRPRTG